MTASPVEVRGAIEEGVELYTLQAPLRVEPDGKGRVAALWTQPQISGTYDRNGRPRSVKADKAPMRIPCDVVLVAIGQEIDSDYFAEQGIPTKWKRRGGGRDLQSERERGPLRGRRLRPGAGDGHQGHRGRERRRRPTSTSTWDSPTRFPAMWRFRRR